MFAATVGQEEANVQEAREDEGQEAEKGVQGQDQGQGGKEEADDEESL